MARFWARLAGCLAGCLFMTSRALLFCSCLMIAIVNASYILMPRRHDADEQQLAGKEAGELAKTHNYAPYLTSGALVGVALCGLHGNYTRDPKSLKLFALLAAIVALLHGFGFYNVHKTKAAELAQFNATMHAASAHYNWPPFTNSDTNLWDAVQSALNCCGLFASSDWFDHPNKPSNLLPGELPPSCCPSWKLAPDESCRSFGAFKIGCLQRYEQVLASSATISLIDSLVYVSLAMLALIVADHRRPAGQYAQFDGAVYYAYRPQQQQQQQQQQRRRHGPPAPAQLLATFPEKPPPYAPPSYSLTSAPPATVDRSSQPQFG